MRIFFKSILWIFISVLVLLVGLKIYIQEPGYKKEIVANQNDTIYFLNRDTDSFIKLYSTKVNMQQPPKLIYSHVGKDASSENIMDYYVDHNNEIYIVATVKGEWAILSMFEGEKEPRFIKKLDDDKDFDNKLRYLKDENNGKKLEYREGSVFLQNGKEERLLKRFIGLYDSKFNPGYMTHGFSPDGKYVLFAYNGNLSALEGFVNNFKSKTYIMDVGTGKTSRFVDGFKFQWMDPVSLKQSQSNDDYAKV